MPVTAFVSSFVPTWTSSRTNSLCSKTHPRAYPLRRLRASADTDEKPDATQSQTSEKPETTQAYQAPTFEAPSFDTDVFSNFVDNAQAKIDELKDKITNTDYDELLDNSKTTAMGLVDNALAGDWLNRGELYGAIQVVFVLLLLRGPGGLDGLVQFVFGPLLLLIGGVTSGKALWDLGAKQLSIWPSPVPGGELRSEGAYGYVRHPMYSGLILASAGFSVATGSPARLAITVAFAAFLIKKIEIEEKYLSETYPDYDSYCEEVSSKILPGIF